MHNSSDLLEKIPSLMNRNDAILDCGNSHERYAFD